MRKILPQQAVDQFNTLAPRLGVKRLAHNSPAGYADGRAKLLQLYSMLGEAKRLATLAEREPRIIEALKMCEEIKQKPGWTYSRISIHLDLSGSFISRLKLRTCSILDTTYADLKLLHAEVMQESGYEREIICEGDE